MARKYEKVRELLPIIKEMQAAGRTHKEIAKELGLANKTVVENLLYRERQKKSKVCRGFVAASRQKLCRNINTKTSD